MLQRYVHSYQNPSRLFSQIESLFAYLSDVDSDTFEDNLWLDGTFEDLCEIFLDQVIWFRKPKFDDFKFPVLEHESREKEIVVCISGGKDSTAVAYHYKKLGYKVYLYHSRGINRSYYDEYLACKRVAEHLDLPLFAEQVSLQGDNPFVEHPMKNMLIACGAIAYALDNKITPRIAFGNFSNSHLDVSPFEVCGGDCIEMWQGFDKVITKVIPDWEGIQLPLETNADTFHILLEDWALFEKTVSCMSPYRFREHWRHRVEQNYNVRLMENRCGSCWKCAIEDMWLMDHDKRPYSLQYYLQCYAILGYTICKEMGMEITDPHIVWDNYLFYPYTESKVSNLIDRTYLKYKAGKPIFIDKRSGEIYGPIPASQRKN